MIRNGFRVLLVLWVGSLWSLAGWVALTIFHAVHDVHLAGTIAARLLSIEFYLGVAVALGALLTPARGKLRALYLAVLLLAVNEFALKPLLEAARTHGTVIGLSFGAWHGVSALLYGVACLAVLLVIWKQDFG